MIWFLARTNRISALTNFFSARPDKRDKYTHENISANKTTEIFSTVLKVQKKTSNLLTMVMLMTSNMQAGSVPSLPPCPSKPNCVSSQARDNHHIEPFKIAVNDRLSFDKLRMLLVQRTDTKLISSDDTTIRVEFRTPLGFVDDGLFVLDSANGLIHIRSAARLGYWDLGKNRSRMEEIRRSFEEIRR